MPEENTKLHPIDKENIYRAFQEYTPVGDNWIGKWGIFKNNTQLMYIQGEWWYGRRNEATMNRNLFVGSVYIHEKLGDWSSPMTVVTVTHDSEPIRLIEPVDQSSYNNSHDIRGQEPDLFQRLQELFVVREITADDMNQISRQLGAG